MMPYLLIVALITIYIVLGILYESLIHPITIFSTLPSAGVGALLALLLTHVDLTIIAFIGIILLVGIVKKNAIMMIDFALDCQRNENMSSSDAIYCSTIASAAYYDDDDGGHVWRVTFSVWIWCRI